MKKGLLILGAAAVVILVLACRKGKDDCLATATVLPVIPPAP